MNSFRAIVFVFLFPMLELCSFYLAVGGQPQGLKLGVVNEELGNFTTCKELKNSLGRRYGGEQIYKEEGNAYCILEGLSCKYLDMINDDMVVKVSSSMVVLQKRLSWKEDHFKLLIPLFLP